MSVSKKKTTKKASVKQKTSKKSLPQQKETPKLKQAQERLAKERKAFDDKQKMKTPVKRKTGEKADPKTYPPIVKLMDEGLQKEIEFEAEIWNKRLFTSKYKGTKYDRFPLSASQGGKCALALARNLAHYFGVADYPRDPSSISTRVQRIFARGHLLEGALIGDIATYTPLSTIDQQRRVRLFSLGGGKRPVEGNIDVMLTDENGVRILTDMKSKGAYHSAAFQDSIDQFFQELRQTGMVEEIHPNCFYITDAYGFFDVISMDDFFVDYLIQLNAYAFAVDAETNEPLDPDFVALYYENKNTCANYQVCWKPNKKLYEFLEKKFNYVYDGVREVAASHPKDFDVALEKKIPKEFALGSARCRLCDHNERCWGKYDPTLKPSGFIVVDCPKHLEDGYVNATRARIDRSTEDIIIWMQQKKVDATHVRFSDGTCYEKKYYKSPKPHYDLKQCKEPRSDR